MRVSTISGFKPLIVVLVSLFLISNSSTYAQDSIDWGKDTLSQNDANNARDSYTNSVKRGGLKGTARINLPVDKLKTIIDACAAKGIEEISAMIVTIRSADVARYRRNHPNTSATDEEIKWSQLIVFRIPRHVFSAGNKGSKINRFNHPTVVSLLSMGLVLLEQPYGKLAGTGDVYFEFGTVCPPPAACD